MNRLKLYTRIATLGPIGYYGAPGTVATVLTLPAVFLLHTLISSQKIYIALVLSALAVAIFIVKQALKQIKRHHDPSEIVLDEVIGCLFVFWGITLSVKAILVGFLLFRALDIIKFGWIKRAEAWADAWGVMGDDIMAALITNIILRILF